MSASMGCVPIFSIIVWQNSNCLSGYTVSPRYHNPMGKVVRALADSALDT